MPTGRRVITRSMIEGLNQDKSIVSCVYRRVLHTLKPEHTVSGIPEAGYRWWNIDIDQNQWSHKISLCHPMVTIVLDYHTRPSPTKVLWVIKSQSCHYCHPIWSWCVKYRAKAGVSHIVSLDPFSRGHLDVVSTTWFLHLRERCFLVLCTLTRCRSTPRMERVDDSKATSPSLEGHEDLHSELSRYKGIKTQSLKALKL